jgi:arylsulfatase A-like enzyme
MKLFRQIFLTLFALTLLTQPAVIATQTQPRKDAPNILMILVDDFGQRDLSIYGSTTYETPNMDRLAATGMRFTQAYVAYPRCVPSRFAILTGKLPAQYQGSRDSVHVEPGRDTTFGQPFQQAGYETFFCGKWHLGDGPSNPGKVGFTKTIAAGAAGATRSHFAPYNVARRGGGGGEEDKAGITGLDDAPRDEYLADRLTEETAKFIEQNRNRPFLAVLAHYAVHTPIEAKADLKAKYAQKIAGQKWPEKLYEPESAGENLLVQNNATYAAMVESVDLGVGRLMKLLDQLKLTEKTIVIIASDHGGLSARGNKREVATSNRPFRAGKGHLYEGGLRIPLIVRWPGKTKAGSVNDTPVISTDLFPTYLEMAGLPLPPQAHRDGVSFANLLKGGRASGARNFYWHNPAPRPNQTADLFSSAIRIGNLKLIEFPEEQRIELYDLDKDPGEAHNLASERPADRDRLLQALHAWKQKVGASDKSRARRK